MSGPLAGTRVVEIAGLAPSAFGGIAHRACGIAHRVDRAGTGGRGLDMPPGVLDRGRQQHHRAGSERPGRPPTRPSPVRRPGRDTEEMWDGRCQQTAALNTVNWNNGTTRAPANIGP